MKRNANEWQGLIPAKPNFRHSNPVSLRGKFLSYIRFNA